MKYYKVLIIPGYVATIEANTYSEAKQIAADVREEHGENTKNLSYVKPYNEIL